MTIVLLVLLGVAVASEPNNGSPDFDTEIIPVLTKAGCNSGACHGAATGRGGFQLSLFGSNPSADHESIAFAFEGRRINQARPNISLILRKPTNEIDHGGDMALPPDSPGAELLRAWIQHGAKRTKSARVVKLEVTADRWIVEDVPAKVQLQALATFEDGRSKDVTAWTIFQPTDPASVSLDSTSMAHVVRPGQHAIVARFLDQVVAIELIAPIHSKHSHRDRSKTAEAPVSIIDIEIQRKLDALRLTASPIASDDVWLRRVYVDLVGRLPTPEERQQFTADDKGTRRTALVDRLLASDDFVTLWTMHFSHWLRIHTIPNEPESFRAYVDWLQQQIRQDVGINEVAIQLLTSTGDSHHLGPANFYRMSADARSQAELAAQFFAGIRIGCANCHNHPLDRWTQDDYHGFAAIFAKLERGRVVKVNERGSVTNVRTGEPAVPRIPGLRDLTSKEDHRSTVADWLLNSEEKYVARVTVNRLWRVMFGRGLVAPSDDIRPTNPATHPELLRHLTDDFVANGYRIRHTLKTLALSDAYARSSSLVIGDGDEADNATDDGRFYSHRTPKPLSAEVLMDAICDVVGVPMKSETGNNMQAVQLIDPSFPSESLDLLGRCKLAGGCNEESQSTPGLARQLHLLNGSLLNDKITNKSNRLHLMIQNGDSDQKIIEAFFLRALTRQPTDAEREDWGKRLAAKNQRERKEKLEDFLWSLLSSRLFQELE